MLFFKKKKISILAPISGEVVKIESVNDPVFSSKMLGDGFAIIPSSTDFATVVAPIDGQLTAAWESGHAYGISETKTNVECLVHIGIDTVELNGKGFKSKVVKDSKINALDELATVDLATIIANKKDPVVLVVFTKETTDDAGYQTKLLKTGTIKQGELVAEISKK